MHGGAWRACWLLLAGLVLTQAVRAQGQESRREVVRAQLKKPPELAPRVSYEWERTARLLTARQLSVEPEPEGKRIAFIIVVRDEVFVRDEVWPLWFNWFHGTTRDSVVRRELLFQQGEPFREARSEETMRNLRGMGIFALVRIVPVKGAQPGEVGVLVHTRDLWSLRLETDFNITNQLNSLLIRGTELNAFGRNKSVSADFTLLPRSYAMTQSYYARRALGSSLALRERAGLVFNRSSGQPEGKLGSVSLGQPFYSLAQRLAWTATYSYDDRVYRNLRGRQVLLFGEPDQVEGPLARRVYRGRSQQAYASAYFRRGDAYKQTFSLGWDFRTFDAFPIAETMLPEALRDSFEQRVLPRRRTDHGPTFSYDIFMPRWVTFVNLATYGQSENVRVGPSSTFAMRVPIRALGSSADALVFSNELGLTLAPRGALIDARASGVMRYERETLIDQRVSLMLRGASPVFSLFRFVTRVSWEVRRRDSQNTFVTLGGDNGLRGYQSQAVAGYGADRLLANFELRTSPIEWQAVHLGGVLFYDVGSVYQSRSQLQLQHAVGVGIRLLFPQFNRQPFSFDGGMSFDPDFRFVPTITGGQVVPLTSAEDGD